MGGGGGVLHSVGPPLNPPPPKKKKKNIENPKAPNKPKIAQISRSDSDRLFPSFGRVGLGIWRWRAVEAWGFGV